MHTNATESPEHRIASFVADCSFADLPNEGIETVERAIFDTVGVTVAGIAEGAGKRARRFVGETTPTTPAGCAERALALGTAGHALDYDDLAWAMDGHPSVVLVPPILALAEYVDTSGADAITAYAAGFETMCAIAEPISPDHYERGWHATATFGTFGATAAAASLLDLDIEKTRQALSIAASMPAGLKRNFGSMTKPLHAGLAARSGVTAALLASEGFTADAAAISGDRGFWDLYSEETDTSFSIGEDWRLVERGINTKFYPCCYFVHTSIAAAQSLAAEHAIAPRNIERVEVTASRGAGDALGHSDPQTGLEAKFSMEYAVASAIVHDHVSLAAFEDEALDDSAVQRVREQVTFETDAALDYDSHEGWVRIETSDDEYREHRENPPGTHDDPLSSSQLHEKFTECARRTLDTSEIERLSELFESLRDEDDISAITKTILG